jgi:hypothetical protein
MLHKKQRLIHRRSFVQLKLPTPKNFPNGYEAMITTNMHAKRMETKINNQQLGKVGEEQ